MFHASFFSPSSRWNGVCELSENHDEYWLHFAECCMIHWPGNKALERHSCRILKAIEQNRLYLDLLGVVGINHPSGCFIPASAELISSWGGTTPSKYNCYIRQAVIELPYTAYYTADCNFHLKQTFKCYFKQRIRLVFSLILKKKGDKSHPDNLVFGCSMM